MSIFYLCQQMIPRMQQPGGGVIINTASELAITSGRPEKIAQVALFLAGDTPQLMHGTAL